MANLLLTSVCNRRCPYCFAQPAMAGANPAQRLSLPDLVQVADVLVASRAGRIGVLGGEPTMHPDFVDIVLYLMDRRLKVTVFTNGLTNRATLARIAAIPPSLPVSFVVNVNHPDISTPAEQAQQRTFLATLGNRCEISLNLYRVDRDPCFVADLGAECGTSGKIRLGLAQPSTEPRAEFLARDQYAAAAAQVVRLVEAAFDRGGSVHFDCGFALCSFTDEQLGTLTRRGTRLRFACDLALDIGPTLDCWPCFPLAGGRHIQLTAASRIHDMHHEFQDDLDATRRDRNVWGIFPECEGCAYRKARRCAGGCLAHALRVMPAQPSTSFPLSAPC